jgi:hypothetical protein
MDYISLVLLWSYESFLDLLFFQEFGVPISGFRLSFKFLFSILVHPVQQDLQDFGRFPKFNHLFRYNASLGISIHTLVTFYIIYIHYIHKLLSTTLFGFTHKLGCSFFYKFRSPIFGKPIFIQTHF